MRKLRILITGGGTGGHIYPLIAVVDNLKTLAKEKNIDLRVKYLGAPGAFHDILEGNGIQVVQIPLSKIRRYFSFQNFIDIPKFIWGFIKALWIIFWFMPDALFSKGGPGSLPVVLASAFYFIPIIIHESDTVPGASNKIASRFSKFVALSFKSAVKNFPGKKAVYVGAPVRETIFQDQEKSAEFSKKFMGFSVEKPLIFVIGGSQGATRLNDLILNNLPKLLQFTQILHQTGKDNYDGVLAKANEIMKSVPIGLREDYRPAPYFSKDIHFAYKAADLVISRSGSGSIFDIAALGRPSLLVPLPESAGDHQKYNAHEFADAGACEVMEEKDIFPEIFVNTLKDLLSRHDKLEKMSFAAKEFYKPDAAKKIAEMIFGLVGGK